MSEPVKKCPSCGAVETDPELAFCAKDGTPLQMLDNPGASLVGRTIADRYEILEPLGEGGMGTVYRAKQLGIDREVAIKIIRAELAQDPALQARFEREAKSASRVSSIRIVTLHDYGQTDGGLMYMAMELLDGESVAERLAREGALSPREAVRISIEIAKALEAAHALDVVHRDLKPDNVFLTDKERLVKVLDFGIAKIIGEDRRAEDSALTAVGAIVGTPLYMSPEAAAARGGVGPAADLYSLGVMLFEMLTGSPPFEESEPVLLLGMHLRARPPLLRERVGDLAVPDALEALVDQLLAKAPDDRPQSASALIESLDELDDLSERVLPVQAPRRVPETLLLDEAAKPSAESRPSVPVAGTPPPATSSARSPWMLAGAVLALFAVGATAYVAFRKPEPAPPSSATPPTVAAAAQEATPEDTATARVHVRLDTTPPGAELSVNGLVRDNPFEAELAQGETLSVRARLEGYADLQRSVVLDADWEETLSLASIEPEPNPTRPSATTTARPPRDPGPGPAVEPTTSTEPPPPELSADPLAPEGARERQF